MTAAPKEHQEPEVTAFAPLDCELCFTVTATIAGVTGPLEIRAQRVSTIQRTMRLLKQNGLLVEQPQASSNGSGASPLCPDHQKEMKKGQYGWYCPRKTEDGEYCKQRVRS